jgi:hypothetical protein
VIYPPEPGAQYPHNGYTISSGGSWLPGIYETEAAARYAFQFDNATLQSLSDKVCSVLGEDRQITTDDLRAQKEMAA